MVLVDAPDEIPADNVLKHLNWMLNVGAQEAPSVAEDGGEDPEARAEAREAMQCEVGEPTLTPSDELQVRLVDVLNPAAPLLGLHVRTEGAGETRRAVAVYADEHGCYDSNPGEGAIAVFEYCQGELRAILWPGIITADYTIQDFRGARESLRPPEPGATDGPTS